MAETVLPELKQIIGAMLFVRKEPLGVAEIRRVLTTTAERRGGITEDFAKAGEKRILEALKELGKELAAKKTGFHLAEVAGGWRLENDPACGPWLRTMLQKGRGARLSLPALETLAIIAYRQPCVRAEIESVRGVAVDSILKNLLELQLVKVVGRSELPGRPWMFGTTQKFLEHFGLKSLEELPGTDELRRMDDEETRKAARRARAAALVVDAPEEVPENPGQMKMAAIEEAVPRVETEEEKAAAELSEDTGEGVEPEEEGKLF
ncbi:MAG: SMC-Scp complex subunit ScpB [Kiritimatiellae bacterium]|nr:SMC-Scp complex subunit ScpB [Kiritimatiellia bacterium]